MGPINWLAVVLAAVVAGGLAPLWYRLWGLRGPAAARLVALIVPAAMIGHNFARVGAAELALKPKLYAMMSGGWALAIALPVGFVLYGHHGLGGREAWADALYTLAAFLLMGGVFWALA